MVLNSLTFIFHIFSLANKFSVKYPHCRCLIPHFLFIYLFLFRFDLERQTMRSEVDPSWSIKMSIAAQNFATSVLRTVMVDIQPESSRWGQPGQGLNPRLLYHGKKHFIHLLLQPSIYHVRAFLWIMDRTCYDSGAVVHWAIRGFNMRQMLEHVAKWIGRWT